ncbi:hypothetical protein KCU77_g5849, partial [Aureobasidium melanogenum]
MKFVLTRSLGSSVFNLFGKDVDQETPACPSMIFAHHCAITSGALVHDETCTTRSFLAVKKSETKTRQNR